MEPMKIQKDSRINNMVDSANKKHGVKNWANLLSVLSP